MFGKWTDCDNKSRKIRGYLWNTTYTFQGIKYANAKRFQMPEEIQPWDGIKDATSYGYVCPLLTQDVPNGEIMVPHRYWPMDEHCQYLNVWTQTLDTLAKTRLWYGFMEVDSTQDLLSNR